MPHAYDDPLVQTVWPMWSGRVPLHLWRFGERFTRNLISLVAGPVIAELPSSWQWLQFVPLVIFQAVAIAVSWWDLRPGNAGRAPLKPGC